jgi:hypothetical protein
MAAPVTEIMDGTSESLNISNSENIDIKLKLSLIKHYAMKTYGGVDVYIHVILTSALLGGECTASDPGRFTPGTHWMGGWLGPRAGLDEMEK